MFKTIKSEIFIKSATRLLVLHNINCISFIVHHDHTNNMFKDAFTCSNQIIMFFQ